MKITKTLAAALAAGLIFSACQTEVEEPNFGEVDGFTLEALAEAGFNTTEVVKVENGYIVEKDIFMTDNDIANLAQGDHISGEHYSTTNLVTGTPRTITVRTSISSFNAALDEAIARYNAESMTLTFQKVSSGADINIVASPWYYRFFGILGSAGFPTAGGDPFNQIQMTTSYYSGAPTNGIATVIAHEMGHCIGFRHTDYADRSYSCGGATDNEGDGGVGAVYIPGTPTGPSANSWMLACGSPTGDRPFTSEDVTALTTLY
ncbi:MAG TPA: protease B [Cytophagales bacterium]|nr:protease B [Cytophagales bacterium]HAA24187.1 protease B [Cytophagales bacterium]HAP60963.1 protease B [Cytophagales bacterium]